MRFILLDNGEAVYKGDTDPRTPAAAPVVIQSTAPTPAYDLAPLTFAQATVDGLTVNKDGSIWNLSPSSDPLSSGPAVNGLYEVRRVYGYYSPLKNPALFAYGRAHWGQQWADFEQKWNDNPYQVFMGDPDAYLSTGGPNWITFALYVGVSHFSKVQ